MNPEDQDWEPPSEADMKLISARRERSDQISKLMSGYLLKGYKMLGSICAKCDTILLQSRQGENYCVCCSELDSDTHKDNPAINESAAISMARELELASAAASQTHAAGSNSVSGSIQASVLARNDTHQSSPQSINSATSFLCTKQDQGKFESKSVKSPRHDASTSLSVSGIDVQSFTSSLANSSVKDETYPQQPSTKQKASVATPADSGFHSSHRSGKIPQVGGGDLLLSDSDSVHVLRLRDKINWASQEIQDTHSIEYSIHLCQLIKIASEAIVALRNARM